VSTRRRAGVRVTVDSARCTGHARCYALAPEAFDLDDDGYALVTERAVDVPGVDLHTAAASCPEQAITVEK
jgi:ferredoxin